MIATACPATVRTDAIGAARENLRTELYKAFRGLHWPGEVVERCANDLLAAIDGLIAARLG